MMEKFDGIRVYWNGKVLRDVKNNIILDLPKDIQPFPSMSLEGELWLGYNKREDCAIFLKNKQRNWNNVKIIVFDVPTEMDKPYSARLDLIRQRKLAQELTNVLNRHSREPPNIASGANSCMS
jgi:DNA ligase-1